MTKTVEISSLDPVEVCGGPAPAEEHVISSNRYGSYCVPWVFEGRDVPELLRDGQVYEPETIEFLQRHVGSGDVVSGGAFVGDFLPALHERLSPDARLHSFEPFPTSFDAAAYTVTLNGLDRVSLHRCAVGADTAVHPLVVARAATQQSLGAGIRMLREEETDASKFVTIDVPVRKIDDLVPEARHVSLMHLDVEGHEIPALRGAAELLRRCAPLVVLEGAKPFKVRSYLEVLADIAPEAGYTHAGAIEKNAIFRPLGKG